MNAPKLKQTPRYDLEISLGGEDFSGYQGRTGYLGADTLVTFGDTLEECLENGSISTTDQDGGEGPEILLADMSEKLANTYVSAIQDAMDRQDDKRFEHRPANYLSAGRKADLCTGALPKNEHERAFVAEFERQMEEQGEDGP